MKTIWKYKLYPNTKLQLSKGAVVLSVGNQRDEIFMWVELDTNAETEERYFEAFGTGHEMRTDMGIERKYIVFLNGGSLVFHIYERTGL